jgi:hypothetical protein
MTKGKVVSQEYFNEIMNGVVRQLQHRNYYLGNSDDSVSLDDIAENINLILGKNWRVEEKRPWWKVWR